MGQGGLQGHQGNLQRVPASSPALIYPPSPPVKMISDPSELPAPLVNHQELPVTSLANQQSFFSRQFSLPEQANSHRAPMAALHPKDVSMRSTNMKSHHSLHRPTHFLQQPGMG